MLFLADCRDEDIEMEHNSELKGTLLCLMDVACCKGTWAMIASFFCW